MTTLEEVRAIARGLRPEALDDLGLASALRQLCTEAERSGVTEEFSRQKIMSGVRKACQGRPVNDDDLAKLAQKVEEDIRSKGIAEIDADEVGLSILEPLRELDQVAYLRFASVYQGFDSLEDFEAAIDSLRADAALKSGEARAVSPEDFQS